MSIQIVKRFRKKTTAGQPVKVGILANDTIEVHILSYGATIQQLLVPDRKRATRWMLCWATHRAGL